MKGSSQLSNSVHYKKPQLQQSDITLASNIPVYELFLIIFGRLHPLFSIDCGSLLIYGTPPTVIKEAFTSTYQMEKHDIKTELMTQPSELTALQKVITTFSYPVLKSAEEWLEEENSNHIPINSQAEYRYHCYIPLEVDNNLLGMLELHNSNRPLSTECLSFCSTIADLFADIIYHQQTRTTQAHNYAERAADPNWLKKIEAISGSKQSQELIDLQQRIAQMNCVTDIREFLKGCAELFPASCRMVKDELEALISLKTQAEEKEPYVHEEFPAAYNYTEIIGGGVAMKKVFTLMNQVAKSESTVLILGETGTGKELIAKAIHDASARKAGPLIKVNCAAIPPNLIESELFGHEKGAFTGATDKRIGKFELADNGTLFLDEIGEMPLELQVKLLRALQEKEFERVGGKALLKCNVRVIAATNRDLLTEVEKGRFRRDLYFRLNVFPIALPSLRERIDDIPLLASYFLTKYASKAGKKITGFTKGAIRQLSNYSWPGNVRELEHLIERQVLLNQKPIISEMNLPIIVKKIADKAGVPQKVKTIDENERDHIFEVLKLCKGRISGPDGAAKLLGVPATTLNSKIKRLCLNKRHF